MKTARGNRSTASPRDEFVDFVLEQLAFVPELHARRMFGASGIYRGERIFAIVAGQALYLKTDAQSRARFVQRGLGPFTFVLRGRNVKTSYFAVPPEAYDNLREMQSWVGDALRVASGHALKRRSRRPRA